VRTFSDARADVLLDGCEEQIVILRPDRPVHDQQAAIALPYAIRRLGVEYRRIA
jgi:hypothetical protein